VIVVRPGEIAVVPEDEAERARADLRITAGSTTIIVEVTRRWVEPEWRCRTGASPLLRAVPEVGMGTIKVLLFAANPQGTAQLDLAREFREIDEEVGRSPFRTAVELILVPGARPVDLLRKLNENRPQVVHFSSHGDPDAIVLESDDPETDAPGFAGSSMRSWDERDMKSTRPGAVESDSSGPGEPRGVSKSALVNVLRACDEGDLRLVVLNACHTRSQAEALTGVVDCVVSMNRTISDRAAIKFAASFYGALAFGKSVQKAFEQGVARLSAEGIGEVDTPELLVRAGVDASRVVLVGSAPPPPAKPAPEAPFLVPFPRNGDFVGRDGDLARLHASLSEAGSGPVGIRPAGLTGMGGIGKTQLAVEYVYRRREDYAEGIFWIDAAGPLADGFARLATDHRLRWAEAERPRDEQIRAAFAALDGRPHALLVLDNLPDPAALAAPVLPDCVPEDVRCRVLFTTRRHDLGRFPGVEVTILPEEPALRLLLRHPSRRAVLDPSHPDHEHARAIARMLGRLPLALELAGAYLGKFSPDVSLADYREGLRSDGCLATLDADAAELTEADLRRVHDPAVAAMIREQWDAIGDEPARLLLRVASLFPESSAVPIARLGLLAGLADEARPGRLSPLLRAVKHLDAACLAERLEGDQLRLHPLIREFAAGHSPPDQIEDFRRACAARAVAALEQFPTFEALDGRRGVDGLQEDLIAILEICPLSASELGSRLQAVLRLLQREANNLRVGASRSHPAMFAQQVHNRAVTLGIAPLRSGAEARLTALGQPHFRLLWTASRESSALVRTLTGTLDRVTAVAVTPDGRHAFSSADDGRLRLYDLQTGQVRLNFSDNRRRVRALAVTPDGRCGISNSGAGTLELWDIQTGQFLRTFAGPDIQTGRFLRTFEEPRSTATPLSISPDGRVLLSASSDGGVHVWDLPAARLRYSFGGHSAEVTALAVTPDSRRALSASHDRTLKLWDLASAQLVHTFAGQTKWVGALAISPDGRVAVSASSDCTLWLWDLANRSCLRTFDGHVAEVTAVVFAPDGRTVLSGSADRTLRVWDVATGQLRHTLTGHEGWVTAVSVTPDGRHALSVSHDGSLRLWDLTSRQLSDPLPGYYAAEVTAVVITPDGRHVLSASNDRKLRLWDLATGELIRTSAEHEGKVSGLAVTPDGQYALSASRDGTLKLWDLASGRLGLVRTLFGHFDAVRAVAIAPDGRHALSGSHDCDLILWDLETGRKVQQLWGHIHLVHAVAFLPDGRHALSGSYDCTIMLWDLATGRPIRTFLGRVTAVVATPDGRHALVASDDDTLKLWDLATGQLHRSLSGHAGKVTAVAVTADGRHALSGSEDRTLRSWDIEQGVCRAIIPLESTPLAIAVTADDRNAVMGDKVGNIHKFSIYLD
jgi:WD40 repeat protein